MALGRQNSGTIGSNRTVLEGFGVDMDNTYDLVFAGYGPSAEALQNGQVEGIGTPAGPPVGAISSALSPSSAVSVSASWCGRGAQPRPENQSPNTAGS